ncbi:MAG TPA: hypothetical protein VM683_09345, partial [Anaeromyxobacteraceae bacterium]|nr:hypothetical protein [Anaeromyxobacteraceae bacterium]
MLEAVRSPLALVVCALALSARAAGDKTPPYDPEAPGARVAEATQGDPIEARAAALFAELARDHDKPRALAVLVELSGLEGELTDLGKLATAYGDLAGDPAAHPEVRAMARFRLADLERQRGNLRKSEAELAQLAFLGGWQIAGPFD